MRPSPLFMIIWSLSAVLNYAAWYDNDCRLAKRRVRRCERIFRRLHRASLAIDPCDLVTARLSWIESFALIGSFFASREKISGPRKSSLCTGPPWPLAFDRSHHGLRSFFTSTSCHFWRPSNLLRGQNCSLEAPLPALQLHRLPRYLLTVFSELWDGERWFCPFSAQGSS